MHLNTLHAVLRKAGLKRRDPSAGRHDGYTITKAHYPGEGTEILIAFFGRGVIPSRAREAAERDRRAAFEALRARGINTMLTETLTEHPALLFVIKEEADDEDA